METQMDKQIKYKCHSVELEKENINVKVDLILIVGDFQRRFQVIIGALWIWINEGISSHFYPYIGHPAT